MDKSELILSLILDNNVIFHSFSSKEITCLKVSCKYAYNNKILKNMQNKHRALDLYYISWDMIVEAYQVLKNYRTSEDLILSRKLFNDHKEFVKKLEDESDDIKDCLSRIIIAEYKDLLYNLAYNNIDNSLYYDYKFIFEQIEYEMIEKLTFCNISTHIHDPNHYAFMNIDKNYYKFYDNIEKYGINIFQDKKCKKYIDIIKGEYDSDGDIDE